MVRHRNPFRRCEVGATGASARSSPTRGDKTIRVRFDFLVKHAKYGKYLRRSTTLATHDEKNEAHKGDLVEVVACRRMSKTKCWRLTRVLERGSRIELGADGLEAAVS